jgi:hypothetical protein
MTRTQRKLFDFITTFIAEHGHNPTYEEMAAGIGTKSKGSVSRHIDNLVSAGAVTRSQHGHPFVLSGALTLYLPRDIAGKVAQLAQSTGVTPEAVVIEALRDRLGVFRSHKVSLETFSPEKVPA